MTADTTREQAIDVLAARFANSCGIEDHWDEINEDARRGYRELVTPDVDALVSAGLLVLSPKDEPTADEAWLVFARARTVDYDEWRAEYPDAEDDEEVAFRAGFEAREPSQPKLDPLPMINQATGNRAISHACGRESEACCLFAPRPEFSQVESQYPHRKA